MINTNKVIFYFFFAFHQITWLVIISILALHTVLSPCLKMYIHNLSIMGLDADHEPLIYKSGQYQY